MILFIAGFVTGFVGGITVLAFAILEKTKTHDLTIFMGRPRWIARADRINMTYDELKVKYGK